MVTNEVDRYRKDFEATTGLSSDLAIRRAFNPDGTQSWFKSIVSLGDELSMLVIILTGAALLREREHGTIEHLLVMPLTAFEIALAKVWANGLVIIVAVGLSLTIIVRKLLGIPIAGSVSLFLVGVVLYLFFATAIGIFLGTVARSMPQLGLLFMLIAMPMNMLSGSNTPLESMPRFFADRDAGVAFDPLRFVRPGDPLPWRRY